MRMTARRLLADDTGATAIEYALLVALIAGAIITAALSLGQTLQGTFGSVNAEWAEHMPDPD